MFGSACRSQLGLPRLGQPTGSLYLGSIWISVIHFCRCKITVAQILLLFACREEGTSEFGKLLGHLVFACFDSSGRESPLPRMQEGEGVSDMKGYRQLCYPYPPSLQASDHANMHCISWWHRAACHPKCTVVGF